MPIYPILATLDSTITTVFLQVSLVLAVIGILLARAQPKDRQALPVESGIPGHDHRLTDIQIFAILLATFFMVTIGLLLVSHPGYYDGLSPFQSAPVLALIGITPLTLLLFYKIHYMPSRPFSVAILSLAATIGSTVYQLPYWEATPCHFGIVAAGFPLPWMPLQYPFQGYSTLQQLRFCLFPAVPPLSLMTPLFFTYDAIFYSVIVLGIFAAIGALQKALRSGRFVQAPNDPLES